MAASYEIVIQFPVRPYVRRERLRGSRDNYYVFEDGRRIAVRYAPAWCPRCRAIVHGEDLETVARIDVKFREHGRGDPDDDGIRDAAELIFRREWVLTRRSPPRCLRCFSPDAVVFPHGRRVPHPDGGGAWVTATVLGFCDPMYGGEWILTPEGLPLSDEHRDGGWHAFV